MHPPTYSRRVQEVLSDLAKDHKDSIGYEILVAKVIGPVDSMSDSAGPRSRAHIDRVLRRESRARRIILLATTVHPYIRLTESGHNFYSNWGFHPLLPDRRLKCLTVDQIKAETKVLMSVLIDIQAAFIEFQLDVLSHRDLETMPAAVDMLFQSVDDLEYTNSQLQLEFNGEAGRRRSLRGQAMRARDIM